MRAVYSHFSQPIEQCRPSDDHLSVPRRNCLPIGNTRRLIVPNDNLHGQRVFKELESVFGLFIPFVTGKCFYMVFFWAGCAAKTVEFWA